MACLQPSIKAQERLGPSKNMLSNLLREFGNTITVTIKSVFNERVVPKEIIQ